MKTYLDFERLEAIDTRGFQSQKPYPFANPSELLFPEAWEELVADLPPVELFEEKFGKKRHSGQMPHDRYSLEYTDEIEPRIALSWQTFIRELRSDRYRDNVRRLLGVSNVDFRFHWHYTPTDRGVSPHIDQKREFGSHIFYFNSPEWNDLWGGHTLILGNDKTFERSSAPKVEDFQSVTETSPVGNRSLIFRGRNGGWHAVRRIECPESEMRRVFIVVCNTTSLYWRVRDRVIRKKMQAY